MKCYVLIGRPYYDELYLATDFGAFLSYDAALAKQIELNKGIEESDEYYFFEEGYDEDHFPDDDVILSQAYKNHDWDTYDAELAKHRITNVEEICRRINRSWEEPPIGCYKIEELELIS